MDASETECLLRNHSQARRHRVPFQFVSDEYNGKNSDPGATQPRPLKPRNFQTFTEAEAQNAQSRIYLGIHWQFDAKQGIAQGNKVADCVLKKLYQKAP